MKNVLVIAAAVLLSTFALSQDETPTRVNSQNRSGELPFSSSIGTSVEHVDAATGSLSVRIPIVSVPGRGMDANLTLRFDSAYWVAAPRVDSYGNGYYIWNTAKKNGWLTSQPYSTEATNKVTCVSSSGTATYLMNLIYVDTDGGQHPFAWQFASGACAGPGDPTGPDLSGQGMMYNHNSTGIFVMADGTQSGGSVLFTDPNGNQRTDPTDTLGRTFYSKTTTTGSNGSPIDTYSYVDSNGTTQNVVVTWEQITRGPTAFNAQSGLSQFPTIWEAAAGKRTVVQSITLPNNREYQFQYDSTYGDITRIDFPAGGYVTYGYSIYQSDIQTRRYVSNRTEYVNGQTNSWNITLPASGPHDGYTSTVTDPLGNQTQYTSIGGAVSMSKIYSGSVASGTLLRQYQVTYAWDSDPFVDPTYDASIFPAPDPQLTGIRPTQILTTLDNGLVSKKEFDYETFTYTFHPKHDGRLSDANFVATYTTSRGNVTEAREYDWGSGAPGPLLRRTRNCYLHNSNSAYLNANIVDKITTQQVYSGTVTPGVNCASDSANQAAFSQYDFDTTSITPTSGAPQHDYINYSSSNTVRGNVTRVSKWRNTDNTLVATTYNYDDLGNILSINDPLGHTVSYDYTDNFQDGANRNSHAYVTTVTLPNTGIAHIYRKQYDWNTGLLVAHCGQNYPAANGCVFSSAPNQPDYTTFTYDLMKRPLTTRTGDAGSTTLSYNGDPVPPATTKTVLATPNPSVVSSVHGDGFGRTIQTTLDSDPQGVVYTDTTYDALGRVSSVSNPYRSTADSTYGITTTQYDALGRVTLVTKPDGSVAQNTYSGQWTTLIDEAGKPRWLMHDALGRLIQVNEPDPATGAWGPGTGYWYDALGNLTQVIQNGSRQRNFTYDSLSELLTATNPESGTITYAYDNDGNMIRRTDARNFGVTYAYDPLHRLITKNDGSTKSYYYDVMPPGATFATHNAIGRLTHASNNVNAATSYAYDAMGRINNQAQCIPSNCDWASNPITATYNLAGGMTSITYPSGRKVIQGYDAAGRLNLVNFDSFNGTTVNSNYWSVPAMHNGAPGFFPNGSPQYGIYGSGLVESFGVNNRLQPCQYQLQGGTMLIDRRNYYGNASSYCQNSGVSGNNGNVISVVDGVWNAAHSSDNSRTQYFAYDYLNRLTIAGEGPPGGSGRWSQTFTYDAWGNMNQAGSLAFSAAFNANNQMVGYSYDAAGNLLSDGNHSYAFDAENQITGVDSGATTYTYDANGQRVRKTTGSNYTEYVYFGDEPIAEKNQAGDWSDYIFAGGKRIAKADNFEWMLRFGGNECASCGWQGAGRQFAASGNVVGRVVQSGDKLSFRQYQASGTRGGMLLTFTDGSSSFTNDQDGDPIDADNVQLSWHNRVVDLSSFAGKTISIANVVVEGYTTPGAWELYYADIAYTAADGTVFSLFANQDSLSMNNYWGTPGMTALATAVVKQAETSPAVTTEYYHGDQLGSARLITSAGGWPVWQGTYLPFGWEWNGGPTASNHYKFTGKERDSESGLDYFGARYYGSSMGRWLSPDWSAKTEPVPYADLSDPQSLNLYAYVRNNPLSHADLDGHESADDKAKKIAAEAAAQKGSHTYDTKNTHISNLQIFKKGSDKCNEFVSDTVKSADGTRPVVDGTGKVPTAAQFADPNVKITGLSAPEPLSNAKAGDVIAQDHGPNPKTGNEEGHVGIVVAAPTANSPGQTASANSNVGGRVTINNWGFRNPNATPNNGERNGASSPAPVVRHPLGDPQ